MMTKKSILAYALGALIILSGCSSMSNTTKGSLIGAGSGVAAGALIGGLIGNNAGGAAIGAAIGGAVGTGAGYLIGKKMDKAKAAAEAVEGAEVEEVTDANGLEAVKVTFDSGILFATGKSTLQSSAQSSLTDFATNVLIPYSDIDVAIQGYTDNQGWSNSTAEESKQKNIDLSLQRAQAVSTYLIKQGVPTSQIKSIEGLGEENPVADNSTAAGQAENRRVEIYLYASAEMIEAAQNGTLQ